MTANETVMWGCSLDYSQHGGGASYVVGGTIAGSALATFQANTGKNVSIMHIGGHGWLGSNAFSAYITNLNILTAAGILPCIDWLPADFSNTLGGSYQLRPAAIAAGDWDSYIQSYAQEIKNWGKDVCIRIFVESNITGQYPWQYGPTGTAATPAGTPFMGNPVGPNNPWTNTAADVVGAYVRIGNIFKNVVGCFNAKIVLNLNIIGASATATVASQVDGALPYVDILSMDGYTEARGGAGYRDDFAKVFRGGITASVDSQLQDTYGLMAARHPTMPMMLSECGWFGTDGSTINITAFTRSAGTWTLTLASPPPATAVVGNSFDISGTVPTTYRGEWNIVSGSGTGPWVVTGDSDHGAVTTLGTAQVIDRIYRAAAVTKSLEIDLPAMPRIKYVLLFWVNYTASQWVMDYNGSQPNNRDALALRSAIGNAHYLEGQVMGTDVSTVQFIPHQDQPLTATGALERYRGVCRGTTGLVGAWLLRDAVGTTSVLDDSGFGRNGAVTGQVVLGAANVLPAEPTWTSARFPGNTASAITIAHSTAFNPGTINTLSIETSFVIPNAPASGNAVLVAKGSASNYVWSLFVTTTSTLTFTMFQLNGTTFCTAGHALPTMGIPFHVVASINLAVTATPVTLYLNGIAHVSGAGAGPIGASTAPLTIGLRGDNVQPLVANGRIGPVWIYNTALTIESVADHYAAWGPGPVISGRTALSP